MAVHAAYALHGVHASVSHKMKQYQRRVCDTYECRSQLSGIIGFPCLHSNIRGMKSSFFPQSKPMRVGWIFLFQNLA